MDAGSDTIPVTLELRSVQPLEHLAADDDIEEQPCTSMGVQMDEVEAEATWPLAFKRKASTGSHKKPKLAQQDDIDTAILECIRGKLMSFLLHKHSPQYFSCWHCRPPEGRRLDFVMFFDDRIEKTG